MDCFSLLLIASVIQVAVSLRAGIRATGHLLLQTRGGTSERSPVALIPALMILIASIHLSPITKMFSHHSFTFFFSYLPPSYDSLTVISRTQHGANTSSIPLTSLTNVGRKHVTTSCLGFWLTVDCSSLVTGSHLHFLKRSDHRCPHTYTPPL